MTYASQLAAIALGLALTAPALAQTSDTTGGTDAASDEKPSAHGFEQVPGADAPVQMEAGATVLPNGQDITPDHMENGRWYTADDIPTFKIEEDGTVDYSTFSGYRRYHAECHVCHGPDGEGSTYAPALKNSVLNLDYYQLQEIVASGKQEVNNAANQVMPAFATNPNVWCYIEDIYVYLLARGTESIPRGRPAKKADKSPEFAEQENSCMSM